MTLDWTWDGLYAAIANMLCLTLERTYKIVVAQSVARASSDHNRFRQVDATRRVDQNRVGHINAMKQVGKSS